MIIRGKKYPYEEYHKEIDGVLYKKCSLHKDIFLDENEWIPATSEYFYTNKKNNADGLYPYCKKCGVKKARIYQVNHLEESYASHKKYRRTLKYQKWNRKHKEDNEEYLIDYRKGDKFQRSVKLNYEYRKLHKQHDISIEEWEACKKYFEYECAYCGLPFKDHYRIFAGKPQKIDFHKEHFDNKGKNDLSNCLPSCQRCNNSKKGKLFEDWYPELSGVFNKERLNKIKQWLNVDYKKYIKQRVK